MCDTLYIRLYCANYLWAKIYKNQSNVSWTLSISIEFNLEYIRLDKSFVIRLEIEYSSLIILCLPKFVNMAWCPLFEYSRVRVTYLAQGSSSAQLHKRHLKFFHTTQTSLDSSVRCVYQLVLTYHIVVYNFKNMQDIISNIFFYHFNVRFCSTL